MSNSLDPDQAQRFVRPDQDPNCLQSERLLISRQQKLPREGKELNTKQLVETAFWLNLISFSSNFSVGYNKFRARFYKLLLHLSTTSG